VPSPVTCIQWCICSKQSSRPKNRLWAARRSMRTYRRWGGINQQLKAVCVGLCRSRTSSPIPVHRRSRDSTTIIGGHSTGLGLAASLRELYRAAVARATCPPSNFVRINNGENQLNTKLDTPEFLRCQLNAAFLNFFIFLLCKVNK
jgi:hypothetical protein